MTKRVLTVVCTGGRRPHSTRTLAVIDVDGDTLSPRVVVDSATGAVEGLRHTPFGQRELAADPARFANLRPVAGPVRERSADGKHEKWRFVCPKCMPRRDVPVSDARMKGWVGNGHEVIDVSRLPAT